MDVGVTPSWRLPFPAVPRLFWHGCGTGLPTRGPATVAVGGARPDCHGANRSGWKSASISSLFPLRISEASSRPITGPSVMPLWETAS